MRLTWTVRSCVAVLLAAVVAGCPSAKPERTRITQEQIDNGSLSVEQIIAFGRMLDTGRFGVTDGYGNGRDGAEPPNLNPLLGPDNVSCSGCHGLGGFEMGWGSNMGNELTAFDDLLNPTLDGSNERNTTMAHGTGWIDLLGKEITFALWEQRDNALAQAADASAPVTVELTAKGVAYGELTAMPDGTLDTSAVSGCDPDLLIKAFHAKGHEASVRIFTRTALNRHHGIQSYDFLKKLNFNRRNVATWDEDQDGIVDELNEGELTAMTVHQITLPAPVESETGDALVEAGRLLMTVFGCVACHKPSLRVEDPVWRYTSSLGGELIIDLTDPALPQPRLAANLDGSVDVPLWSDLKRHDLGPESHEPLDQPVDDSLPDWAGGAPGESLAPTPPPIPRELMLTTELWGVIDTGPWWHDGTSPSIDDAIRRHGGEAQNARDAYVNATATERNGVLAFLGQLQVSVVADPVIGK